MLEYWNISRYSQGESSPLPTALAHVGLLPGVLAHVGDEGARLGEGFPADQALAWLLSWGSTGGGGWGARGAGEASGAGGTRTGVDADVALQSTGVGELALAVHAHVRLLPAVDPQVPLQVTWEQGRMKDTGSPSPFSSLPEPQKLPWERLVLFREQGLRRDRGKLAASCLGWGSNVEGETARTSTWCLRGSRLHWDHSSPLALQQAERRWEETSPSLFPMAPWRKPGIHAAQPWHHKAGMKSFLWL